MPRFVLLRHTLPASSPRPSHWDLMLEDGPVLKTWALPVIPGTGDTTPCEGLPDHRLSYLDYEGPVAGDRGEVERWDEGSFAWLAREASVIRVRFDGRRLRGEAVLRRAPSGRWELALG